jgi:hypothetical protein
VALAIAIALEYYHQEDNGYLFLCYFNASDYSLFGKTKFIVHLVIGVGAWWTSQMWLCRHIWVPKNYRLERVQRRVLLIIMAINVVNADDVDRFVIMWIV